MKVAAMTGEANRLHEQMWRTNSMLASETITSHQDGPLNQIPDKAAIQKARRRAVIIQTTVKAFPETKNQCPVAVNIEYKKEKIQKQRKEDMASCQ